MKKFDTNQDGKLDFEEFRAMLNSKKKDKQFISKNAFVFKFYVLNRNKKRFYMLISSLAHKTNINYENKNNKVKLFFTLDERIIFF